MKMVKDKSSRQVTFSKRRTGLFKKAHELATLCAVHIAITVFSPGGKPYCFGSPDFDFVTKKFLNEDQSPCVDVYNNNNPSGRATGKMNQKLDLLQHQIELEKKKGTTFKEKMKNVATSLGFMKPVKKMGFEELHSKKNMLVELQRELQVRSNEIEALSSLLLLDKEENNGVSYSN
ncbi:Agamous-like MADS-box protein AGL29 [Linum grandiflorum]